MIIDIDGDDCYYYELNYPFCDIYQDDVFSQDGLSARDAWYVVNNYKIFYDLRSSHCAFLCEAVLVEVGS